MKAPSTPLLLLAAAVPALAFPAANATTTGLCLASGTRTHEANLAVATTTSTSCPSLPSSIPLPTVTELPNPFEAVNGSQVTTKDEWDCRQQEINALFQLYELGRKPDAPSVFTPTFSDNTLSITAG